MLDPSIFELRNSRLTARAHLKRQHVLFFINENYILETGEKVEC